MCHFGCHAGGSTRQRCENRRRPCGGFWFGDSRYWHRRSNCGHHCHSNAKIQGGSIETHLVRHILAVTLGHVVMAKAGASFSSHIETLSWCSTVGCCTIQGIPSQIYIDPNYKRLCRCIDKPGLLLKSHGDKLTPAQKPFARDNNEWPADNKHDLLSVIQQVKPHVLIGTSTKPKAFTEEAIREMAKHVERPIVFPLSNPTRLHEAQPNDLYEWTDGKALVATGSPFPPVEYRGKKYDIGKYSPSRHRSRR